MTLNVYQSTRTPLVVHKNQRGADIFRIERDGTIYCRGINFADGSFLSTANDTDALVTDGGEF